MIDPAFGAFPISDTPPVFKLGRNFDRHARMGIDPSHLLVLIRTRANVDSGGFEADEPRNWKAADRAGGDLARRLGKMGLQCHHADCQRAGTQRGPEALSCQGHLGGKSTDFAGTQCTRSRLKRAKSALSRRYRPKFCSGESMAKTKTPLVIVTRKLPDSIELR